MPYTHLRVPPANVITGGAASLTADATLSGPLPSTMLLPAQANLHELHALTPAAFLDVIAPPYDASKGRDATYLRALAPLGKGGVTQLQRIPQPAWFSCKSARYTGPAFDG